MKIKKGSTVNETKLREWLERKRDKRKTIPGDLPDKIDIAYMRGFVNGQSVIGKMLLDMLEFDE